MRFHYRYLNVEYERNTNGDLYWWIEDSNVEHHIRFESHPGDDLEIFWKTARVSFIGYLNSLGIEGWEVVSYNTQTASEGKTYDAPFGHYLLIHRIQD